MREEEPLTVELLRDMQACRDAGQFFSRSNGGCIGADTTAPVFKP